MSVQTATYPSDTVAHLENEDNLMTLTLSDSKEDTHQPLQPQQPQQQRHQAPLVAVISPSSEDMTSDSPARGPPQPQPAKENELASKSTLSVGDDARLRDQAGSPFSFYESQVTQSDSEEDRAEEVKEADDSSLGKPFAERLTFQELQARKKQYSEKVDALIEPVGDRGKWEFGVFGWVRSDDGGMKCVDEEEMGRQKGVLSHLIKSAGAAIVSGKSLMNISLPVRVFEPRSFLQRMTDVWTYAPVFLSRAALATAAIERMQNVVAFVLSGLHRGSTNLKPFNPILGETFQAGFRDGSQIHMEQVSHHPPISAFQIYGPDEIWHMHGVHEVLCNFSANSIRATQFGLTHIDFLDGSRVTFNNPYVLLKGTMWGERNFQWSGTVDFADPKSNVYCQVVLGSEIKTGFKGMFSKDGKADIMKGEIYQITAPPVDARRAKQDAERASDLVKRKAKSEHLWSEVDLPYLDAPEHRKIVSVLNGSWMDGFEFDGKTIWTKDMCKHFDVLSPPNVLPSDCTLREDLVYLKAGKMDEAQHWKQVLEQKQRDDRELRKNAEKLRKKK